MIMKCIKNGEVVRRVEDDVAINLVSKGGSPGWVYCPKSDWKKSKGKTSESVSTESSGAPKKHKDNSHGKDYKRKKAEKRLEKAE